MSYAMGTKVRLVQPWRAYGVDAVLEQGFHADLEQLVRGGIAVRVDEAEPGGRPATFVRKAARKVAGLLNR